MMGNIEEMISKTVLSNAHFEAADKTTKSNCASTVSMMIMMVAMIIMRIIMVILMMIMTKTAAMHVLKLQTRRPKAIAHQLWYQSPDATCKKIWKTEASFKVYALM